MVPALSSWHLYSVFARYFVWSCGGSGRNGTLRPLFSLPSSSLAQVLPFLMRMHRESSWWAVPLWIRQLLSPCMRLRNVCAACLAGEGREVGAPISSLKKTWHRHYILYNYLSSIYMRCLYNWVNKYIPNNWCPYIDIMNP